jgi:capsular polysaccharide transport system permease protein
LQGNRPKALARQKAMAEQKRAAHLGKLAQVQLNPASAALYSPAPTAQKATMRPRHWWLLALFIGIVVLPTAGYGWYLFTKAADQYESNAGFSSRTEKTPSAFEFLGALAGGSTSSSSDMDIVFEFIRSQELMNRVDAKLNLRTIFSKPANDPLMRFAPDGSIEDLLVYWQSMVVPTFDRSTGLMRLTVWAFDPNDAQAIAVEVLAQSTAIINDLSKTAQVDTTRYAQESLTKSEQRMAAAQQALTNFRVANGILDPAQQVLGTAQVVNTLVQQLATTQIELDLLSGTVPDSDPRLAQLNRRISVIQNRIVSEQAKVGGLSDPGAPNYAKLVSDYQNLIMEQDFAQKAYLTALGAYDLAVNDAQHQTRYLATYLQPTLAQTSTAPQRGLRTLLAAMVGLLAWSIGVMIYYALRDRR